YSSLLTKRHSVAQNSLSFPTRRSSDLEDNEVRNFKTLLANLKGAFTGGWPKNIKAYFDIADRFRPEVVVSDFESWSYLYGMNHRDRKSTRLNSSHVKISYAVFCLTKKR